MSPPFPVKPVPSLAYYPNPNLSFNTSTSSIHQYPDARPMMDPRTLMETNIDPRAGVGMGIGMPLSNGSLPQDPNVSSISHNTSYSTIPHLDPGVMPRNLAASAAPVMSTIHSQEPGSSQSTNPFIYPSSPSLYLNPKDRDNASEVSSFAKATPKQLSFSNHSTPVQQPPPAQKFYKPIQHSPVKQVSSKPKPSDRRTIPQEVLRGFCPSHNMS